MNEQQMKTAEEYVNLIQKSGMVVMDDYEIQEVVTDFFPALVSDVRSLTREKAQLRIDNALLRRGFSPTASAEIERLRAALEPFANMSDAITKLEDKAISNGMTAYYLIALRNSDGKTEVLAPWHFRKAAEALKGGEG